MGFDAGIEDAAHQLGVPPDLLRIALCLGLSFPLCGAVKRVSRAIGRELLCISGGLLFLVGIFNMWSGLVMLLVSSGVTWLLTTLWPDRWYMPWLNFVVTMGLMLVTHIKEQLGGGDYVNNIGISGSQMILVIKLTSLGWDVYDGTRPVNTMSEYQQSARILPGQLHVLRYLAWVLFFPAILTGPSCGYREFNDWVTYPGKHPRSGHVALLKAAEGLFYMFLYVQTSDLVLNASTFYISEPYVSMRFSKRAAFLYLLGLVHRFKYYAAWCIAEAACIHSGLGYRSTDKVTGRRQWDRVRNVNPLKVETAQNIHDVISNWNMNTNKWLRHYVYLRLTPRGRRPGTGATMATFVCSALWHGTRPGYYLTFIMGAFLQQFGKVFRRQVRPIFLETSWKRPYDLATWVVTQLALGYIVTPFFLLNIEPSLQAWASVYFYIHLGLAVSWLLLLGPLKSRVMPLLQSLHQDLSQND